MKSCLTRDSKESLNTFILRLALLWAISIIFGCRIEDNPETPSPTQQDLNLTTTYSGTARTTSYEKHKIHFELYKDGEAYSVTYLSTNPSELASGKICTIDYVEPGDFKLYAFWDWNDDVGQQSYEPQSDPFPIHFVMDGFSTKELNVNLVDRTNPSDLGWVTGTISYSGFISANHPLYVVIKSLDYATEISNREVNFYTTAPFFWPYTEDYYYECKDVPSGGSYRVLSFWDENHNGIHDGDDKRSDWAGPIMVSPGLPTSGIDMTLN